MYIYVNILINTVTFDTLNDASEEDRFFHALFCDHRFLGAYGTG